MDVLVFCKNAFPVCCFFIASEVTNIVLEVTDIEVNLVTIPDMLKSIL